MYFLALITKIHLILSVDIPKYGLGGGAKLFQHPVYIYIYYDFYPFLGSNIDKWRVIYPPLYYK